ncbi:MAG TPA: UdgX family uracil-DNA binding protein [Terriglobales bacterium]
MPRQTLAISAADFLPDKLTLSALQQAARKCRGCPLWERGTQTVFGEGPKDADYVLVGEQPGDKEDRTGHPFVGPAGALLDRALEDAGLDRSRAYVTNAVKHFKWEPKGKLRIHSKPNRKEIVACHPWLDAEVAVLQPAVIVCLGATAAQSLLGSDFRVTQHRGELITHKDGRVYLATVHPSSILRGDPETRHEEMRKLVADLKQVARVLRQQKRAA